MKILVPVTYAELGGSQVFLLKLMDAFASDPDVSFHALVFQPGPLCGELEKRKIPYRVMTCSLKKPWTLFSVIREIRKIRPDVIYLHAGRVIALISGMLGIPCVERINMSRVSSVGGWCSRPWIDRICTSLNTRVLAVSGAIEKQLLDRGIRKDKIIVIRNFVETDRFHHPENKAAIRKELGISGNTKLVINVGRYTAQKAQQDLISAAAEALKQEPDLLFMLIGSGPREQEYRRQAESLGISDRIRFTPFCRDVEKFYQAADFMLHTAHWAPLDNVLLEAMAAGLPIIASNADGTNEVILHEKTGLLFEPGDTHSASDLLLKLVHDEMLSRQLGKNAFEFVSLHHSIPAVREQFRKMFADLAEKRA